ncbi:Metal tolerance protein 3 [Tolypocladium ophioglossoides CBS 100239]|uniref:Metal tolerance protein 3 n=1 Tax=Tolypocladium ophioglossoides (strain CBS 100239) TaxID=1163406 RepID=A0A0L0N372_TOLOC|nr:Metal tolerance protein 3 [Tolypocladium ophioglossoides CBS 100239]
MSPHRSASSPPLATDLSFFIFQSSLSDHVPCAVAALQLVFGRSPHQSNKRHPIHSGTPDASNTITHHPSSVFHLQHLSSPSCGSSHSPARRRDGTSTAVEPSAPAEEANDAFERHPSRVTDVESQMTAGCNTRIPRLSVESDPYGLSFSYKTDSDLDQIKANSSRKRDSARARSSGALDTVTALPEDRGKAGPKRDARKLRGFYENQNAAIERMLKSVEEHRAEARQEQGDDQLKFRIAIYGSLAANILLAGLQLYAAISSGSLSLFTTMADAIFDPLSTMTLIVSNRAIKRVDPRRFPAGKARLETVGNIVFCFLMTSVSLIIIAFAAQELAQGSSEKKFHLPSVISVCAAFLTKLSLFLYCWSLKDKYSQVNILWQDHRNDLLVNGFGILTSVGGAKLDWWIDPMGAILLSLLISGVWLRTALGEFILLVGVVASVDTQQLITYVCLTHSGSIQGIDTVRVYHSGPRLIAEVDIVMDPTGTLLETHDVAEELQFKLESLPDIERAYVHIDYETTHKPEHTYKKDL